MGGVYPRPQPGAKQLACRPWNHASCFAPGAGDHQGRPYVRSSRCWIHL
ncbi:MAG TPA: hypothetical protein VFQ30_11090 [Ktedonobacteraceae bacterium]|nr:hypothetical protein [Ktedonobacteraceae bacterium]